MTPGRHSSSLCSSLLHSHLSTQKARSLKEGLSGLLSSPQCWDTAWNIEALDSHLLPDFLPFAQSTHPLGLMGSLLPSNSTLPSLLHHPFQHVTQSPAVGPLGNYCIFLCLP